MPRVQIYSNSYEFPCSWTRVCESNAFQALNKLFSCWKNAMSLCKCMQTNLKRGTYTHTHTPESTLIINSCPLRIFLFRNWATFFFTASALVNNRILFGFGLNWMACAFWENIMLVCAFFSSSARGDSANRMIFFLKQQLRFDAKLFIASSGIPKTGVLCNASPKVRRPGGVLACHFVEHAALSYRAAFLSKFDSRHRFDTSCCVMTVDAEWISLKSTGIIAVSVSRFTPKFHCMQ